MQKWAKPWSKTWRAQNCGGRIMASVTTMSRLGQVFFLACLFSPGGELQRPLHPGAPQGRPLHPLLLHPPSEPGAGLWREERWPVGQSGNQRHLQPGRVLAQRAHTHSAISPRRVSRSIRPRPICSHRERDDLSLILWWNIACLSPNQRKKREKENNRRPLLPFSSIKNAGVWVQMTSSLDSPCQFKKLRSDYHFFFLFLFYCEFWSSILHKAAEKLNSLKIFPF